MPDSTDIRIIEEEKMNSVLDAKIRSGLCTCFPADAETFAKTRAWHGSHPDFSVILESEEGVIAHVGVVNRRIHADATPLRIAGPQNLFVIPSQRGKKLFNVVMQAAMEEARRRRFDMGLLFCTPDLGNPYEKAGWKTVDVKHVIRVMESGKEEEIPGKNITMYYPLLISTLETETIHLGGNDW
ncbi:MAG: GNAT family N-acetyltransferase [Chthoniobacterales bacterium]